MPEETSLDYFLKVSRQIVKPAASLTQRPVTNLKARPKTKSPHERSAMSINLEKIRSKPHNPKITGGISQRSLLPPKDTTKCAKIVIKKKKGIDRGEKKFQTGDSITYKSLNTQNTHGGSFTEVAVADKPSTIFPNLTNLEDFDRSPSRQTTVQKTNDEPATFIKSQRGFFNINPNSAVAKYITECFKDPVVNLIKKKVNRKSCVNLTQRMADLKSTTQPEYSKNHGTMLSCELWGNKKRIECRQRIESINNLTRAVEQSIRERRTSIQNTSIEFNGGLTFDEDIGSELSTKATLNFVKGTTPHNRGKSLIEFKQLKMSFSDLNNRLKIERTNSDNLNTQRKTSARIKIKSLIKKQSGNQGNPGNQVADFYGADYDGLFVKKKNL